MKNFFKNKSNFKWPAFVIMAITIVAPVSAFAVMKVPELLAGWRFEDPSTVVVADFSGNNFTGTNFGLPRIVAGKFGKGLITDASNYVTTSNTIGNFGTGNFTISVWFKTAANTRTSIISKRSACMHENFWEMSMRPGTGHVSFEVDEDAGGTNYMMSESTVAVNDGQWHHLVAVRNSNKVAIYVDGQLDGTGSAVGVANLNNAATLGFGRDLGSCDSSLATIDEVRIYNRVLNPSEIRKLRSGFEPGEH